MNAEFNVWLLIVGLVLGAGLVWLVIMDSRRRETEVDEVERLREAAWLSAVLAEEGVEVSPDTADRLLLLHRARLELAELIEREFGIHHTTLQVEHEPKRLVQIEN